MIRRRHRKSLGLIIHPAVGKGIGSQAHQFLFAVPGVHIAHQVIDHFQQLGGGRAFHLLKHLKQHGLLPIGAGVIRVNLTNTAVGQRLLSVQLLLTLGALVALLDIHIAVALGVVVDLVDLPVGNGNGHAAQAVNNLGEAGKVHHRVVVDLDLIVTLHGFDVFLHAAHGGSAVDLIVLALTVRLKVHIQIAQYGGQSDLAGVDIDAGDNGRVGTRGVADLLLPGVLPDEQNVLYMGRADRIAVLVPVFQIFFIGRSVCRRRLLDLRKVLF